LRHRAPSNAEVRLGVAWELECISAAAGNLLTAAPLTAENLDNAIAALRKIPTQNGTAGDASPAVLIVPSDFEGLARRLIRDLDTAYRVVSVPWLNASGHWYLLASPSTWPVIAQAVSTWMDAPFLVDPLPRTPVVDEARRLNPDGTWTVAAGVFDAAAAVRLRRDTGYSLVGRHAIRCEN
jgi:hypothetical protein